MALVSSHERQEVVSEEPGKQAALLPHCASKKEKAPAIAGAGVNSFEI
jgi:hypothetical protein